MTSDILEHPDSTVGEIAARTGLPQSAVSTAVARLKEAGAIITTVDPRDRRRSLVRRAEHASRRVAQVRATPVDDAVAAALADTNPAAVREVLDALGTLTRHLRPREPRVTDRNSPRSNRTPRVAR
ncbi:helix-turn-helix domain-containing protein [Nocardia sp. NBC_01730]|uniref:MarR family transcriptional regulator n=1 Tax=Nocardia sp. NBC_01730 TaxID=2975998 RepID=UPI002E0E6488|nr:helix-turn-helix domain-containing protein [Nocardia sp. NBC_01730]